MTFEGNDRITVVEEGGDDPPMVWVREGTGDPLNAPQAFEPPDGLAVPAALLGEWTGDGKTMTFENHEATMGMASGGSLAMHYRVVSVEGETITLHTWLHDLPYNGGDTIEVTLSGTHLTWYNTGSEARSEYDKS